MCKGDVSSLPPSEPALSCAKVFEPSGQQWDDMQSFSDLEC